MLWLLLVLAIVVCLTMDLIVNSEKHRYDAYWYTKDYLRRM